MIKLRARTQNPKLVQLVATLPSEQRTSMAYYLSQLYAALEQQALGSVEIFKPPALNMGSGKVRAGLNKANRYLLYQALLSGRAITNIDTLFHITDHGYAHLGWGLPLARQLVTVHDLVLLKIKNGALPVPAGEYPTASIRSFELSLRQIKRLPLVIADSHATAHDLTKLVGIEPARIRVVHLGVSSQFQPLTDNRHLEAVRSRYNLPPPFILHVGHSGFYKNLETVLASFARLGSEFQEVCLVKVGTPLTASQREQAQKLGIARRVIEVGAVAPEDLAAVYNLAQVLFFPSLHEGFGLPPLEAMACGTPVLTSNVASLPEVVGQAAISLPPHAIEGYTAALKQLLSDQTRHNYYRQAGFQQARRFSWGETARQTAAVYQELFELQGMRYANA